MQLGKQGQVPDTDKRSGRTEPWSETKPEDSQILPLISSESSHSLIDSPLFGYLRRSSRPITSGDQKHDDEDLEDAIYLDDASAEGLNPMGPWNMNFNLKIPTCPSSRQKYTNAPLASECQEEEFSRIHPSCIHASSPVVIKHYIKLIMRVERGDDLIMDKRGKRKKYDIIIEVSLMNSVRSSFRLVTRS